MSLTKRHSAPLCSPDAIDAFMAMKPEERPMSLTTDTPPALYASTRAQMSDRCASSTAVSNPNVRSICGKCTKPSAREDTDARECTPLF